MSAQTDQREQLKLVDDPCPQRWKGLLRLTKRQAIGRFSEKSWDPSLSHAETRVLVVGAGGLGCEILKNLALSGFRNIDIIDMDTIDLSNLNRQFLFRQVDVGKSKAEVAAAFVMTRIPGVKVTPHFCAIEEKDDHFYVPFNVIILGLDSIKARAWICDKLSSMLLWDDSGDRFATCVPDSIIPIIDGGTEGFKGHIRVIYPTKTASFQSTLNMFPPQVAYPLCTIEHTPRLPEHCVAYVSQVLWGQQCPFGKDVKLDGDNPQHVTWATEKAKERGKAFGISGVDYRFAQGVLKNIIPAIASTNAIVAAACVTEALKMATGCNTIMNNYTVYNGNAAQTGIYGSTIALEPDPDDAYTGPSVIIDVDDHCTVQDFMQRKLINVALTPGGRKLTSVDKIQLKTSKNVAIVSRGMFAEDTEGNETKPITSFIDRMNPDEMIYVMSPELEMVAYVRVMLRIHDSEYSDAKAMALD